jgi:SAM-dependent methyltransferase
MHSVYSMHSMHSVDSGASGGSTARTRAGYDQVADRYAAEIGGELAHKPLDRALLDAVVEVAAGGLIADVGAGPGHVAAYLRARGGRAMALDLSPAMCAIALRDNAVPAAAADLTRLPIRSGALAGLVCLYAVIHLGAAERAEAYREFCRVLRPGGQALVAFHVSDEDFPEGGAKTVSDWWGHQVDLTFRFLDPHRETGELAAAGLALTARLDRTPHPSAEHASRRCYLLVERT